MDNRKRVGGLIGRGMMGTPAQRKAALYFAATGKKSLSARLAGYSSLTARSGGLWQNPAVRANIETAQRRLQRNTEAQGGTIEALGNALLSALNATTIEDGQERPDHETRLAAVREILRIHGL